jgi:hemerythrin superfamily protein
MRTVPHSSSSPASPAESSTASGLSAALRFDHERLLSNTRHVCSSLECGESGTLGISWSHLCQEMRAHMEAEEQFLLPSVERTAPEVSEGVRRDHAHLRDLMDRITAALAEGNPSATKLLQELVAAEARHAAAEEKTLYPWSEYGVGEAESKGALRHIEEAGVDRRHQELSP